MDEPPAKRPRRDDREADIKSTSSPRSPRPPHEDYRSNGYDNRRRDTRDYDNRKRKRSRSRSPTRDKHNRRDRSRDRDGRSYRDRDRDRDRDRHGDGGRSRRDNRERDHKSRRYSRSRSHSRSPHRNGDNTAGSKRTRSPLPPHPSSRSGNNHDRLPPSKTNGTSTTQPKLEPKNLDDEKMDIRDIDDDDPEAVMKHVMGFGGFRSTKNTKVPGNQIYYVRKEKKTEYRQYMNRVGGFNRPLSPTR